MKLEHNVATINKKQIADLLEIPGKDYGNWRMNMKLELNVEYTLKDNKGYVMAIDQSTSFKTIMDFVDDYRLDNDDVGIMYMLLQSNGVAYIYLVKATGYAVILSSLKAMGLKAEGYSTPSLVIEEDINTKMGITHKELSSIRDNVMKSIGNRTQYK